MIAAARTAAVLAGAIAFLFGAIALQSVRGLEGAVLVDLTGRPMTIVGPGLTWVVGAVVFGVLLVAGLAGRRADGVWWALFGGTLLVLLGVGSVVSVIVPIDPDEVPPGVVGWLIAGAGSPLAWGIAAVATVLAISRRPSARVP